VRIHADGSTDPRTRGTSMLYPAWHRGWTDDIYGRSRQAAFKITESPAGLTAGHDLQLVELRIAHHQDRMIRIGE